MKHVAAYATTGVGMALACCSMAMLGHMGQELPGLWLVIGVLASGVLSLIMAISIAEMSLMFPGAPGVRTYLKRALGDTVGLAGPLMALTIVALFATVEVHYFLAAARWFVAELGDTSIGLCIILAVTAINLAGYEAPQWFQRAVTAILAGIFVVVAVAVLLTPAPGVPHAEAPTTTLPAPSFGQFAGAVGGGIFLYTGFEWITSTAKPKHAKHVAWAMPVSIIGLCVLYGLLALAFRHVGPPQASSQAPQIIVGQAFRGSAGGKLMAIASLLAMASTLNAGMMGSARLLYALARERRFHGFAAKISLKTGAPYGAIVIIATAALISHFWIRYFQAYVVAELVCAALYCLVYALFMFSAVRLRRTQKQATPGFSRVVPTWLQGTVGTLMAAFSLAVLSLVPAEFTATCLVLFTSCFAVCVLGSISIVRAQTISQGRTLARPPDLREVEGDCGR